MLDVKSSIRKAPLPRRIVNCLTEAGIETIQDLLEIDLTGYAGIQGIPGIGKHALKKIENFRNQYHEQSVPMMIQGLSDTIAGMNQQIIYLQQMMERLVDKKIASLLHDLHLINTVVCEQYKILQHIQLEKSPDGILKKINEKVPGFSATVYDLYEKLEKD